MMKNRIIWLASEFAAAALAFSCKNATLPAQTKVIFDTPCTVNLFECGTKENYDAVFARLCEIQSSLDAFSPESQVSQISESAGISPVKIGEDVFFLLKKCREFAKKTDGAFDPTIFPLSRLWKDAAKTAVPPSAESVESAKSLVDWRMLVLDENERTAFLRRRGMGLDLGAAAKGFACDEACKILESRGVKRALLDFGGNICAFGAKKSGEKWRIGIRNPFAMAGNLAAIAEINFGNVVTSGIYERNFEFDGKKYHHIIDAKTGFPAENEILSFTIVCENSLEADILSTAGFVLGEKEGLLLVESVAGAEAACIGFDKKIRQTSGKPVLQIADESFSLADE